MRAERKRLNSAKFQSTPPCAGGDLQFYSPCFCNYSISIHAPLCGGRLCRSLRLCRIAYFNPRPPVRGATTLAIDRLSAITISIHAPLCGGRPEHDGTHHGAGDFNPRPPVRGATILPRILRSTVSYFNPRPPVRGATHGAHRNRQLVQQFQSTPPCAGGDTAQAQMAQLTEKISIHAPLCGGRLSAVIIK